MKTPFTVEDFIAENEDVVVITIEGGNVQNVSNMSGEYVIFDFDNLNEGTCPYCGSLTNKYPCDWCGFAGE